ncbi:hypothetical protein Syun_026111 [Stephania yunnanensis]|uniref:Uncharacterized protein n=1 Tax=Stephania yunnanensis TaxID=152371 RepID=A0AAP0ESW7_9MAGN
MFKFLIQMAIPNRHLELTQMHGPDTLIDETELHLFIREHGNKGWRYGLGWTPSGSRCKHAGVGSSQPMFANTEPIELLRKEIKKIQTNMSRMIEDKTLTCDQLRDMQGWLGHIEQAVIERLGIHSCLQKKLMMILIVT